MDSNRGSIRRIHGKVVVGETFEWKVNTKLTINKKYPLLCSPIFTSRHSNFLRKWQLFYIDLGVLSKVSSKHRNGLYIISIVCLNDEKTDFSISAIIEHSKLTKRSMKEYSLYSLPYPGNVKVNGTILKYPYAYHSGISLTFKVTVKANPTNTNNAVQIWSQTIYLEYLFLKQAFADVTFKFNCGQKIRAHKIIIMRCSDTFWAIFNGTTKDEILIQHCTYQVFKELLHFIYLGEVKNLEIIEELLAATKHYLIDDLKAHCADILAKKLDKYNALRYFQLAEKHGLLDFKELVVSFIATNLMDVSKLTGSTEILQKNTNILSEILRFIARELLPKNRGILPQFLQLANLKRS